MDQHQQTIEVRQDPDHVFVTGKSAGIAGATVPAPRTVESNALVSASSAGVISAKSRRCRLASNMTVPALDSCSGACSTTKCSPSTM
jgi:hypothetical protein